MLKVTPKYNMLIVLTILVMSFIVAIYFSQIVPSQQPALTQCLDDVSQPGCYHQTNIVRPCCVYMGLPGYYREVWNVQVWRHVRATVSVWWRRVSRIQATGERCTPLQPLTCRPIPP